MTTPLSSYDLYYPGPIAPVAKVGQNMGVWTNNTYRFFRILFIEGLPGSPQLVQDIGAVNANSVSTETRITVVDAPEGSIVHCRCAPLDDIEFEVSEIKASKRFVANSQIARVSLFNAAFDPYWALTTMFVLGNMQSIYVTAYNNTDYNEAKSRLKFWGLRYTIDRLDPQTELMFQKALISGNSGELDSRGLRATIVPAMGRGE